MDAHDYSDLGLLVAVAAATVGLTACSSSHQVADRSSPSHVESPALPKDRVIVLGRSIGAISLDEQRTSIRRAVGPGKRLGRGVFSYFRGRLLISYWFHDQLTSRVNYIKTTRSGFHTRSGPHVGMSRRALHLPAGSCANGTCGRDFFTLVAAEPRLSATVIQTVGSKGYDGFLIALVGEPEPTR